jgi:hypothetical protein
MGWIQDFGTLLQKFPRAITAMAIAVLVFVLLAAFIITTSAFTGARFTVYPQFGFDSAVWPHRTLVYQYGREYDIAKVKSQGGIDMVDDFKNSVGMDVNPKNTFCYLAQVRGGSPQASVDIQSDGIKTYRIIPVGDPNAVFTGTVRVSCVKLP